MGSYNVSAGHCPSGMGASGAVGILNESNEARAVNDALIKYLRAAGHEAHDCTCNVKATQSECLNIIVNNHRKYAAVYDISIHLNAGGGTGVEVWNYDNRTAAISDKICSNISNALGIKNRGTKYTKSLYFLNNTPNQAMLIECCFVDSQNDASKWNADLCGKAIAEALVGAIPAPAPTPTPQPTPSGEFLVKVKTDLNIRKGPGVEYPITGTIRDRLKYTIVETARAKDGGTWGKLKSGAGWINISPAYVDRV